MQQIRNLTEDNFQLLRERITQALPGTVVGLGMVLFVFSVTVIVAFDNIFPGFNDISTLQIGDVTTRNIVAPDAPPFVSELLTQQANEEARNSVQSIYDLPDPNIAGQQVDIAAQIFAFIDNVRQDPFATSEQKITDIHHITALSLEETTIRFVLNIPDESWEALTDEMATVLQRVMRQSIREGELQGIQDQLPTQVSVRFDRQERDVIVAIVNDLLRPNTFENTEATQEAQQQAVAAVQDVLLSFERGEIIVRENERIDAFDFEVLEQLGLLRPDEFRAQAIVRAFLASLVVLFVSFLYIRYFTPQLLTADTRMLAIVTTVFMLMLIGTRFLGINGNIYLFPASALALLIVAIRGSRIALLGAVNLAFLSGLMANNSLEVTSLVAVAGIVGSLTLTRAERLNSFFVSGAIIGVAKAVVVGIFFFSASTTVENLDNFLPFLLSLLSGALLAPATAIAGMYAITLLFNLPTPLKVLDLSQPSKPLLQRLLREAPGTYQHSLQVANLAEQAANAIGADAQLVHVAALYHDIGKMLNPIYFTENQQDIAGNPHDALNDPHRSADIIISHVTEGDEMAKQYRLPSRIRDFIREHHGTSQVYVFYQQALNRVGGDESLVDLSDFTYPGPKPRTRETAIMMLADSCEAAVRSVKPASKPAIHELVNTIIEDKRKHGQLDESGLTLNDLKAIRSTFVEVLQGIFHPRINYQEAVAGGRGESVTITEPAKLTDTDLEIASAATRDVRLPTAFQVAEPKKTSSERIPAISGTNAKARASEPMIAEDDDAPMAEVPPLPRTSEKNNRQKNGGNGKEGKIEPTQQTAGEVESE